MNHEAYIIQLRQMRQAIATEHLLLQGNPIFRDDPDKQDQNRNRTHALLRRIENWEQRLILLDRANTSRLHGALILPGTAQAKKDRQISALKNAAQIDAALAECGAALASLNKALAQGAPKLAILFTSLGRQLDNYLQTGDNMGQLKGVLDKSSPKADKSMDPSTPKAFGDVVGTPIETTVTQITLAMPKDPGTTIPPNPTGGTTMFVVVLSLAIMAKVLLRTVGGTTQPAAPGASAGGVPGKAGSREEKYGFIRRQVGR